MRISVVIPVYNGIDYLVETLRSVLAQERQADEIIVVDDGSTEPIEDSVSSLGSAITCIRQSNSGQGAARNRGTTAASGDAICFLDADDILLPGALATLEQALLANPDAVAVVGGCELIGQDGAYISPCPMNDFDAADKNVWINFARAAQIRTPGCVLVRASGIIRAGNWDRSPKLKGSEDWDIWLRLLDEGAFVQTSRIVLQYRLHQGSTTARLGKILRTSIAARYKHRVRERNNPERLEPINTYLMTMTYMAFYVIETGDSASSGWSRADACKVLGSLLPFIPRAALSRIRHKVSKFTGTAHQK